MSIYNELKELGVDLECTRPTRRGLAKRAALNAMEDIGQQWAQDRRQVTVRAGRQPTLDDGFYDATWAQSLAEKVIATHRLTGDDVSVSRVAGIIAAYAVRYHRRIWST